MADKPRFPHLHVEFFVQPVENRAESRKQQRPIFEDKEMVRIIVAGDRRKEVVKYAHDLCEQAPDGGYQITPAEKYFEQYELFQRKSQERAVGTPLSIAPFLSGAQAKELEALHIHTIEALAGMEGSAIKRLGMGGRVMVDQAREYLEEADKAAVAEAAKAESAELRKELEELKAMINTPQQNPESIPQAAEVEDDPTTWGRETLREYLQERGVMLRANASEAKLLEAVQGMMADEAQAAEIAQETEAA